MTACIEGRAGRVVGTAGDALLAEFPSVTDAVTCAAEIQHDLGRRNTAWAEDRRLEFRIGIHLGDVMVEGDDIFGDGVNIAARLQEMGEPGGICVSGTVHDSVRSKLGFAYEAAGEQSLKTSPSRARLSRTNRWSGRRRAAAGRGFRAASALAGGTALRQHERRSPGGLFRPTG